MRLVKLIVVLVIGIWLAGKVSAGQDLLREGLAGYWKFDEGKGGIAADSSGKGNHGTIHEAEWVKVRNGFALEFDGNSYVDCGNDESLNLTSAITIEAWIYARDDLRRWIIGRPEQNYGYWLGMGEMRHMLVGVADGTSRGQLGSGIEPIDTWSHIVATYLKDGSSTNLALYRNGVLVQKKSVANVINNGSSNLEIGRWGDGYYFHGRIGKVAIYNRVLTADEIKQSYIEEISIIAGNPFRKIAQKWPEYKNHLKVNKESPLYQEAGLLQEKWGKILRLAQASENLSKEKLTDGFKISSTLLEDSEKLKRLLFYQEKGSFSDNFEKESGNWKTNHNWEVKNGLCYHLYASSYGYALTYLEITEGTIEVTATTLGTTKYAKGGCFGIMVRYIDVDNWCAVRCGEYGIMCLLTSIGGTINPTMLKQFTPVLNQKYKMRVVVREDKIIIFLDDIMCGIVEIPFPGQKGRVGLFATSKTCFDDFKISQEGQAEIAKK